MKIPFSLFRVSLVASTLLFLLFVQNVTCAEEGVVIDGSSANFSLVANQPRLLQIPKKVGEDVVKISFDAESVSDLQVKWICDSIPTFADPDQRKNLEGQYMFCQYPGLSHYFVWVSSNKNITNVTMTLDVLEPIMLEYNKPYTYNSVAGVLPYVLFMVSPEAGSGNNIFVQLSSSEVTSAQYTTAYLEYDSENAMSLDNVPTWYVVVTTNEVPFFDITVSSKPIVELDDTYEQTATITLAPKETKAFVYQAPIYSYKISNSQFQINLRDQSNLPSSSVLVADTWSKYYDFVVEVTNPTSQTVTGNVTFFKSSLISLDSHSLHTFQCTPGRLIDVKFPPLDDTSVISLNLIGDNVTSYSPTIGTLWSSTQGFLPRGTSPFFELSCSATNTIRIGIVPVYGNEINTVTTNGQTMSYRLYTNNIHAFYAPAFISTMQLVSNNASNILVKVPNSISTPTDDTFLTVGGTNNTYYVLRIEGVLYVDVNITFHLKDYQVVPNNATTTITATQTNPVALKVVAPMGPFYYLLLNGEIFNPSERVYWRDGSNEAIVLFYENTTARLELTSTNPFVLTPIAIQSGVAIPIIAGFTQLSLPSSGHFYITTSKINFLALFVEGEDGGREFQFQGEAELIVAQESSLFLINLEALNITFTYKASNILCLSSSGSTVVTNNSSTETSSSEASKTSTDSPTSNTAITPPSDEGEDSAASLSTFSILTFTAVFAVASI